MVSLTFRQERRQRFIYNICRFVANACAAIVVIICLLSPLIFNLDQQWQAVSALAAAGSALLLIIAIQMPLLLKLLNHYEAPEYTLPYTAKQNRQIYYLVTGILFLAFWVILSLSWNRSPLTAIIAAAMLLIFYGLFFFIIGGSSFSLNEDHLQYRKFKKSQIIYYKDIDDINIETSISFEFDPYYIGLRCRSSFMINTPGRSVEINMAILSNADLMIILNIIHQNAPNATMNELAEQMRNGDFPVA